MAEVLSVGMSRLARPAGDRSGLGKVTIVALSVLLVVTMAVSMTTGASGASLWTMLRGWFGPITEEQREFLGTIKENAARQGDLFSNIFDVYALKARSMLVLNSRKWGYDEAAHATKSSVPIDRCLVLRKGAVRWRRPAIDWG